MALNLHRVVEYGTEGLAESGTLWKLEITPLEGGYVSDGVYRQDVTLRLHDHRFQTISVVQKYTNAAEVYVMELLSELPSAVAIPRLIDSSVRGHTIRGKEAISWFTVPFYEGAPLTFDDEVPVSVIRSLAQLHAHFAPRVKRIESVKGLYQVDTAFFDRTFENALKSLAQMHEKQPDAGLADMRNTLEGSRQSPVFERALRQLPVTLAHGDVHPGNILQSPEGKSVLIDWGNARIAPAMLDIANVVGIGSANWEAYLTAWEHASGEPLDVYTARLGYHWATAMVNLQYLPFAADSSPDNVPDMVERICNAKSKLEVLLGQENGTEKPEG